MKINKSTLKQLIREVLEDLDESALRDAVRDILSEMYKDN